MYKRQTYQWQESVDSENWTNITGEVSTTLQFSTVATETRYYRAEITSTVNNPTALDQMHISIAKNANALAVGEIYYVKIGSGTYPFTTTNTASNTDDIGQGLAEEINDNAPGVSSSYDADVNIISIIPLQNGGGMRLTISKYYLPSGKSISEVGVTPDIFVEEEGEDFLINSDRDNQLNYAIKLFNS